MSRLRIVLAVAVLAVAGRASAGRAGDAPAAPAAPAPGVLRGAAWRGAGGGESLGGSACWLRGPEGEVRIEVTRQGAAPPVDAPPAWGRLLTRGGEGWVVLLGPGTAVAGRWGGPLEPLDPDSRLRLETLLALLEGGADGDGPWPAGVRTIAARAARGPRAGGAPPALSTGDALRLRLPETASLRTALEARGRGRGGGGETWRIRRTGPPAAPGPTGIVVTSTRLPGRLELRAAERWPVRFDPDDAFVPVWSLGELLTFPEARPGAGGGEAAEGDGGR